MNRPLKSPATSRPPYWFGAIFVLTGLFILLVAADVLHADPSSFHAPRWVVGLCGIVFVAGGVAVAFPERTRIVHATAMVILAGLGSVGAWVAFFGESNEIRGGLSFLPHDLNLLLGRAVFGFGAACCFLLLIYALRRGFRSGDPP